jgi:hypothetical protein
MDVHSDNQGKEQIGNHMSRPLGNSGAQLIARERIRQITDEHHTPLHDDEHEFGELADAAIVYASPRVLYVKADGGDNGGVTFYPPWPYGWGYRGGTKIDGKGLDRIAVRKHIKDDPELRIAELVKAGALIAAEIDRLQRLIVVEVSNSNG